MNIDAWTKLLGILISLLQIILWPLIVLSILFYLRGPLKKFLDNLNEFTFKVGSVEATARRQLQVGIALGAASVEQKVDSKASTEQEIARLAACRREADIRPPVMVGPFVLQNLHP